MPRRPRSCPAGLPVQVVQQEAYFLNCLRYIELNPVRAGIVNDPGDYKWSGYRTHAIGVKV